VISTSGGCCARCASGDRLHAKLRRAEDAFHLRRRDIVRGHGAIFPGRFGPAHHVHRRSTKSHVAQATPVGSGFTTPPSTCTRPSNMHRLEHERDGDARRHGRLHRPSSSRRVGVPAVIVRRHHRQRDRTPSSKVARKPVGRQKGAEHGLGESSCTPQLAPAPPSPSAASPTRAPPLRGSVQERLPARSRASGRPDSPDATPQPMIEPIDVPATQAMGRPSSSITSSTVMWAKPRAPPPPKARPMWGRSSVEDRVVMLALS
jgi:hypothetical protein